MKTTITLAVCAVFVFCVGCSLRPSAEIVGVSIENLSLDKASLLVKVNVHNPYSVALPLANIDYALSSGGTEILSDSAQFQGKSVPAMGSEVLPVPVTVSYINLLKALAAIRPGKVIDYTTAAKLWVNAPAPIGPIGIPMSRTSELPIPALPRISLGGFRWDQTNPLQVIKGVATIKIQNINEFPLNMNTIDYGLKLAGLNVAKSALQKPTALEPNQEGALEIPISIDPKQVGIAAVTALLQKKLNYELGGSMDCDTKFGKITMPFTEKGETSLTSP